ncbi:hypothetical protein B9G39_19905 [Zooshikella ganghwensis]|uniref:Uncharacterized protein n=1 Tax=Zooshikella ganghwensis TaxID=202772 RepID=A0A4V1IP03_9GAMM|nr:hypothetical protein B9G39_19905 [Zooshikella ganghwensis]
MLSPYKIRRATMPIWSVIVNICPVKRALLSLSLRLRTLACYKRDSRYLPKLISQVLLKEQLLYFNVRLLNTKLASLLSA